MHDEFEYYDSDQKEHSPPPLSMTPLSEYHQQEAPDHHPFEKMQKKWLEQLKARGAKIVQVIYPRTANNDKELTVVRGEYLEVSLLVR